MPGILINALLWKKIDIEKKEAVHYFKLAAGQDVIINIYYYGFIRHEGDGIKLNYQEAFHYFKNGTEFNEPNSKYYLSHIFTRGEGIPADKNKI